MGQFSLELKPASIVPIHDQLVAYLSEQISGRHLAPGERVPSENELAGQLGISRMTVRRAFDTLVYAGLLVRRQGKGTFVVTESSGLVAFIGQTLTSGISSELVAQVNHAIARRSLTGWHLLVCGADNDPDRQLEYVQTLQRHSVRGLLLAPAVLEAYERNMETLLALRASGLPFVLLERYVEHVQCDYVVSDNFRVGYLATDHLARLGHRRIALLQGAPVPSITQRGHGYRAALQEHGLPFDPKLVADWPDHTSQLDGSIVASLLDSGATAVFCYTDQGAMQVMDHCVARGVRVPEDLALVGVGDLRIAWGPKPVLTTVRQDFRSMAERALDILLRRIDGHLGSGDYQHEVLDVELVVRASCGGRKAVPAVGGARAATP